MTLRFAATEDVVAGRRALPPALRALYVHRGRIAVARGGARTTLRENECRLFTGVVTLEGEGEAWGFELAPPGMAEDPARIVLAQTLRLDPAAPILLRVDRVDFPAGAVTPRHGHAGPGIRRLLFGQLSAEIGPTLRRIDPGQAWFEPGDAPVVGRNLAPASAFLRGMLLDPTLRGETSFRAWTEADAERPRGVAYAIFLDEVVRIPPGAAP